MRTAVDTDENPVLKYAETRRFGFNDRQRTQPLRQSRPIPGLRSMIRRIASGVVSMRNSDRTGSWISTICQGSPVRRSLAGPSITPRSDARVVRQLGTGAESSVVNVREVILQVDPRANREYRRRTRVKIDAPRHLRWDHRMRGTRDGREQPATPFTPADDRDRVGRMPKLGSGLCQVLRSLFDVLSAAPNESLNDADMNRRHRSWALRSQVLSISIRAVRTPDGESRESIEVVVDDRIGACIVAAADEQRYSPASPTPARQGPRELAGSLRIWAIARAFGPPPTRRMHHNYRPNCGDCSGCSNRDRSGIPTGQTRCQADITEESLGEIDHLFDREADTAQPPDQVPVESARHSVEWMAKSAPAGRKYGELARSTAEREYEPKVEMTPARPVNQLKCTQGKPPASFMDLQRHRTQCPAGLCAPSMCPH